MHRDLKPENLLKQKDGTVKIADFGVASVRDDRDIEKEQVTLSQESNNIVCRLLLTHSFLILQKSETFMVKNTAGTPAFLAPECLEPTPFDAVSADIWALGVCLYNMIFGRLPFYSRVSRFDLYRMIKENDLTIPEESKASDSVKELLMLMLTKDPAKRISLAEVCLRTTDSTRCKAW